MSDTIAEWFSTAIGLDVVALRAPWDRYVQVRKRFMYKRDEDLKQRFNTEAPFHIINLASVLDVEKRMKKKQGYK